MIRANEQSCPAADGLGKGFQSRENSAAAATEKGLRSTLSSCPRQKSVLSRARSVLSPRNGSPTLPGHTVLLPGSIGRQPCHFRKAMSLPRRLAKEVIQRTGKAAEQEIQLLRTSCCHCCSKEKTCFWPSWISLTAACNGHS